ncbi:hypothetical protein [Tsukamurella paurometabola]|uniref:Uncharacterized protein n=1 Tax=Tsukamurella paurometabola TaxID=2061 RepID=A0A3P8MA97_TSUPA|nr:hypothetical protein [Tsukamurella paurometabola]MBS4104130.1 hypothetical protein [Tsukamurella paurometabola]UEA85343.1 hypothetical protein LK411_11225 [Tsukamurella paurometabola]VDR37960.1 Uncharacterised protein [Tsukamurella paurometabola]
MTEPTDPQPTPTAPIPPAPAAAPAAAAPAPAPQEPAPSTTGPSRKLLIAAIVFGLIGISGVSFTAGYWVNEATGKHRGHSMQQRGPGGDAQRHGPGRGEGPRMYRVTPTAAPSATPNPAPTP